MCGLCAHLIKEGEKEACVGGAGRLHHAAIHMVPKTGALTVNGYFIGSTSSRGYCIRGYFILGLWGTPPPLSTPSLLAQEGYQRLNS